MYFPIIAFLSTLNFPTSRKGKIARLPRSIREQINRRLDDGEQGAPLVEWLNRIPEVNLVLRRDFNGRPINEQNLTDWRQGGYVDWQQLQESRDWVQLMAEEADQMADDSGLMPVSDRITTMAALSLGKLIRELTPKAHTDSETRLDLLRVMRELTRLRRDDLKVACMHSQFEMNASRRRRDRESAA